MICESILPGEDGIVNNIVSLQPTKSLSEIIFEIGRHVAAIEEERANLKNQIHKLESQDKNQRILDSLPDVLVAQDIADYLHIGRNKAYEWLKKPVSEGGIKSFRNGRSVRCLKTDFVEWLERQKVKARG